MNQREIKFQSIHKDRQTGKITLIEWGPIKGGFKSPSSISNSELIGHRQFTGRKDLAGENIYEGDKMLDRDIFSTEPDRILTVEWRESENCFAFAEIPNSAFFPVYANICKVIGNVYESENAMVSPPKTHEA